MGRLKSAPPRIAPAPPRLAAAPSGERERSCHRDATQVWRGWYKTARWQKLRWSVLVRDMFTCAMCHRIESNTSQLVCDHVEPHRGDEALFWHGAMQTLCKPCHDRHKQRVERERPAYQKIITHWNL
jgi:5-methylcytosine-specific restriction enzyme A